MYHMCMLSQKYVGLFTFAYYVNTYILIYVINMHLIMFAFNVVRVDHIFVEIFNNFFFGFLYNKSPLLAMSKNDKNKNQFSREHFL